MQPAPKGSDSSVVNPISFLPPSNSPKTATILTWCHSGTTQAQAMAAYRPFHSPRRGRLLKHSKLANSRASFAQPVVRHSSELGLVPSAAKRAKAGTRVAGNDFCCWKPPAAKSRPSSHRQRGAMELMAPRAPLLLSPCCFVQLPSSSPFPYSIQKFSSCSKLSATASPRASGLISLPPPPTHRVFTISPLLPLCPLAEFAHLPRNPRRLDS